MQNTSGLFAYYAYSYAKRIKLHYQITLEQFYMTHLTWEEIARNLFVAIKVLDTCQIGPYLNEFKTAYENISPIKGSE